MKEVRTEIEIDAAPAEVWTVLTDFASYPSWNPFVKHIAGSITPGERLTIVVQAGAGRVRTVRPRVLCVDPGRSFIWEGHSVPWLVSGAHCCELEPLDGGRTRFIHREIFTGVLAGVMARRVCRELCGFEEMNRAIKVAAEWLARPGKGKQPDPRAGGCVATPL